MNSTTGKTFNQQDILKKRNADPKLRELLSLRSKAKLSQCPGKHKYVTWYYEPEDFMRSGCIHCHMPVVDIRWRWLEDQYKIPYMSKVKWLDEHIAENACS